MSQTPPSYGGDDSSNQGGAYGQPPSGPQYGYGGGGPQGTPPPNHLVWAILSTILCCLPLGIVSIVFAAQVNSKWTAGDYAGAQEASAKAKKFAIWSVVAFFVMLVIYIILITAGVMTMDTTVESY